MFVKDYMTRHPIMIEPDKRVTEAQKIMGESKIRHLPVVGDGKRILGLITREQLKIAPEKLGSLDVWEITRYLTDLTVKKVMVERDDLYTIDQEATIEEAAALICHHKIGCLPVIEDEIVVGILTDTDLLDELQNLLGAREKGWRVTVRVPDRSGEFMKITSAINEKGWSVMAMGGVRTPKLPDFWDVILKVCNCSKEELREVLEAIEDQKLIDIRETDTNS